MKNMGDYHDHYFKNNVLLLANVFEKFIDTCLKYYVFHPSHNLLLSWIKLGFYVKNDRYRIRKNIRYWQVLIIEKGLRGGTSYIAKKHPKANNKYLNDYDPKKTSTFISYLDINDLYG